MRTLNVEHGRNVEVLVCHVEGVLEVLRRLVFAELVKINEVGAVLVDEGTERKTVLPAVISELMLLGSNKPHVEISHADVLVTVSLALAPQQQGVLRRHG